MTSSDTVIVDDGITGGEAGSVDPSSYLSSCESDNPCEAAWVAAYEYAADRSYDLAKYQALQSLILAGLQYASADRTADLQYDLADRQMVITEEEYARYKAVYRDCEDALAAEICALDCEEVDYDFYAARAERDVVSQFSTAQAKLSRIRSKFCTSDYLTQSCDLAKSEALAVVTARDMAYRNAEARNDFLNERRWSRRVQMFNLGRGIQTQQMAQYSSVLPAATQALQNGQNALDGFLGTLSGAVGGLLNAYYQPRIYAPQIYNGFTSTSNTTSHSSITGTGIDYSSNSIVIPPPRG